MRVVAMIGEPASGKTTLMERFIGSMGDGRKFKYKKLRGIDFSSSKIIVLGEYFTGTFAGTDRLSMAVQPDVESFIRKAKRKYPEYTIVFEGDRLGNGQAQKSRQNRHK